ncbi:hypothetical protein Ptr902_09717 [Pyrenophora tritici-repentis]|nr:hypothetical protein Ptr902_09717 [Pyrenophora tritici-repentis]
MSATSVAPRTDSGTTPAEEAALALLGPELCDVYVNEQPGIASACKILDDDADKAIEVPAAPPASPKTSVEESAVTSPVIKSYTRTSTSPLSSPITTSFPSAVCPSTPPSTPRAKAQPQRRVTFSPDIAHPTGRRSRSFCRTSRAYLKGRDGGQCASRGSLRYITEEPQHKTKHATSPSAPLPRKHLLSIRYLCFVRERLDTPDT